MKMLTDEEVEGWSLQFDGGLRYLHRLFAPNKAKLKEEILNEAHRSKYSSIHLGSTKIYHNLKHQYWWQGMKRDVA